MTDYNDGKWHGWNGGECPVDRDSVIDVHYVNAFGGYGRDEKRIAGEHSWALSCLFRVTKAAPPKPREWWFCIHDCSGFASTIPTHVKGSAERSRQPGQSVIHVREVHE